MALIKCSECGKEISDKATVCPICGNPILKDEVEIKPTLQEEKVNKATDKLETGTWAKGKLVIGIVSMFLFILISFQSCAAGLSNAIEGNASISGSSGLFLAIFMVIAGIVGVATRKSSGKGGAIATIILYWIGALLTIGTGSTFGDLPLWGTVSFIFGFVFLGSLLVNIPIFNEGKNKKIFKIVFVVLIVVFALIGFFSSGTKDSADSIGKDSDITSGVSNAGKADKSKKIKTYGINEPLLINGSEGSYRVTITGIAETTERNMFADDKPNKVIIISYDYENIDYDGTTYVSEMSFKVFDKESTSLETYPASVKSGESLSPGRKTSASMAYGLNSSENYVELEFYDNMFDSKASAIFALSW